MIAHLHWSSCRKVLLACFLAGLSAFARADVGAVDGYVLVADAITPSGLVIQSDGKFLATEIDAIKRRGVLRVSMMRQDQPPYFYWKDGDMQGLDVDLAKTLASRLGVRLQIDRRPTTFNEAANYLVTGDVDLSISKLSMTAERTWFVAFSQPYVSLRQAVLLNRVAFLKQRKSESINKALKTYHGSLGVLGFSSYLAFARKNFPHAKLRTFASWPEATDALKMGKVDALYRDEYEIRQVVAQDPASALRFQTIVFDDLHDRFSVAVNLNAPALLNFVNMVIGERGEPLNVHNLLAAGKQAP